MRLHTKLKAHGVTGNIHKWIEDWLCDRKQRVVINGISVSGGVRVNVLTGAKHICHCPRNQLFYKFRH